MIVIFKRIIIKEENKINYICIKTLVYMKSPYQIFIIKQIFVGKNQTIFQFVLFHHFTLIKGKLLRRGTMREKDNEGHKNAKTTDLFLKSSFGGLKCN